MTDLFTAFFASIPADWYHNNKNARYEGYYAACSTPISPRWGWTSPRKTQRPWPPRPGRAIQWPIYLFEFQGGRTGAERPGVQQIGAGAMPRGIGPRGAPAPDRVEFGPERRAVVGFEVEAGRPPRGPARGVLDRPIPFQSSDFKP